MAYLLKEKKPPKGWGDYYLYAISKKGATSGSENPLIVTHFKTKEQAVQFAEEHKVCGSGKKLVPATKRFQVVELTQKEMEIISKKVNDKNAREDKIKT